MYLTLKNIVSRIRDHKLYFFGFCIAFIILCLLLFFLFSTGKKNTQVSPDAQLIQPTLVPYNGNSRIVPSPTIPLPPKVTFATYENRATLPSLPTSVNTYTFQTNFSPSYVMNLGKKLGLTEVKTPDNRYVILYNFSNPQTMGMLTFDKATGALSFQSYGNHASPSASPSSTPNILAQSYLNYLELIDNTVICPITYQRKNIPGITFVECHRDWQKVGLPILNAVGVLNIPEETKLSQLSLGNATNTPIDTTVVNTSTNQDGKARPNDFNTATVGIDTTGRIVSIDSNIRPLKEIETFFVNDLLTPQEALQQFMSHRSQFALTIPAGTGYIDWQKVYPTDKVQGQKAVITDYLLAYAEKPKEDPQDVLTPMYLIRGTSEISSGYTVRFTEMVPALKNGLTFLSADTTANLLAAATPSVIPPVITGSLKLGNFTPTIIPNFGPHTPIEQRICQDPNTKADYTLDIPGLGKLFIARDDVAGGHTFYFQCSTFPEGSINQVRTLFFNGPMTDQYLINIARWIAKSPNFPPTAYNNINDIYNLFVKINGRPECIAGAAPPIPNCPVEKGQWGYVMDWINHTSENVVVKTLSMIKTSQVSTWAVKPDIFPANSLDNFAYLFVYTSSTTDENATHLTGESPSLYFYPAKSENVDITLQAPLTYSDPSYNYGWHIQTDPQGHLTSIPDRLPYHRLYYEYDKQKISFKEPKEGFIIKKDRWESQVGSIAATFKLNPQETEDLVTDVKNTLANIKDSPYLKISIVDRVEIDNNLSLSINPAPDKLYRINLMITPLDNWLN